MTSNTMRILHLSDIHFGRIDKSVLTQLKSFISYKEKELDLVIITGDLTQRAKREEFLNARTFLESFHCPVVAVPGNHDVPLYNIFLRIFAPYLKFCKFLESFTGRFYENDVVAVYGLWSTNNFSIKEGHLTEKDHRDLEEKFRNVDSQKIRIVASHHGIFSQKKPIKGDSLRLLQNIQPHLLLSGHEHQSGVSQLPSKKFPLIISCGTSTSNRTRTEANSFNIIHISSDESIAVETFVWEENQFVLKNLFKN